MDKEAKRKASERSLKWYYENKQKVSEKNKGKPKIYCQYCEKNIREDGYDHHIRTSIHCKNKKIYDEKKDIEELKEKYEKLKVDYEKLKTQYNIK